MDSDSDSSLSATSSLLFGPSYQTHDARVSDELYTVAAELASRRHSQPPPTDNAPSAVNAEPWRRRDAQREGESPGAPSVWAPDADDNMPLLHPGNDDGVLSSAEEATASAAGGQNLSHPTDGVPPPVHAGRLRSLPKPTIPLAYLRGDLAEFRRRLLGNCVRGLRRRRTTDLRSLHPAGTNDDANDDSDDNDERSERSIADDAGTFFVAFRHDLEKDHPERRIPFRGFDPVVARSLVFDFQYFERPTGELPVTDVLLSVLLYVEADQATLLAVSGVSRAWREAAAHLPQWSVVPLLFNPSDGLEHFAAEFSAEDRRAWTGVKVTDHNDYVHCMKLRWKAKQTACNKHNKRVGPTMCTGLRINVDRVLSAFFIFSLASLLVQFGVPLSLNILNSDAKLGAAFFSLSCVLGLGFILSTRNCREPHAGRMTNRQRNQRFRGEWAFLFAAETVLLMTTCPHALVNARTTEARAMANAPIVEYTSTRCVNATAYLPDANGNYPYYVRIENASEWRVEPWLAEHARPAYVQPRLLPNGTQAGTERLLCDPAAASRALGRTWWADEYLNLTNAGDGADAAAFHPNDGQCFDVLMLAPHRTPNGYSPGPQVRFVLLHPPSELLELCPAAAPIAVAYTPGSPYFNGTVKALWSRKASAEPPSHVTTFRTAIQTRWFPVPQDAYEGSAWFLASAAALNDTALRQESAWWRANDVPSAYLWQSRRVPMIVPEVVMAPEELQHKWKMIGGMLWLVGYGYLLVTFACVSLPRSCISGRAVNVAFGALFVLFCNPAWLMAWGGVCYFSDHPDACLMSKTSAFAVFVTGGGATAVAIITAMAYVIVKKRIVR